MLSLTRKKPARSPTFNPDCRSSATATALTSSPEARLSSGQRSYYVSLVALDSQTALACYADYNRGYASTCRRVYGFSGGVVEPLASLVVHPSSTSTHSVARLGQFAAVVCYDTSSCVRCRAKS